MTILAQVPSEQAGSRRGTVEFLDNIEAVVQEVRRRAVDRFARAPSNCIVLETGGDTGATEAHELIFGIPRVRRRATGVRQGLEIAVVVIRRTLRSQRQLLVGGVVIGGGDDDSGNVHTSK